MINFINQKNINKSDSLFEIKYKLPNNKINILFSYLRNYTITPKKFSSAKLKTLYFDDKFKTSLNESINGELVKTKFRFREYISPEDGGAFYSIEIKKRENNKTLKIKKLIYEKLPKNYKFTTFRSLISTIEKTSKINLNEFYNFLPEKCLYPSTLIKYDRDRFDSPDSQVRYNLDKNISVKLNSDEFSNIDQLITCDHAIFEIKSFKPEFFPIFLKKIKLYPSSFSKFAWGGDIIAKIRN
tara:strand:+ start:314 stop:1036 length:723 start_codon:yes stop_codon:yes gene_type:complete